jgi:hypothetical protein
MFQKYRNLFTLNTDSRYPLLLILAYTCLNICFLSCAIYLRHLVLTNTIDLPTTSPLPLAIFSACVVFALVIFATSLILILSRATRLFCVDTSKLTYSLVYILGGSIAFLCLYYIVLYCLYLYYNLATFG